MKTLAKYLTRYCQGDEQKALAIFAWITSHIKYDDYGAEHDDQLPEQGADSVLARHQGVCDGYSTLFYELALAAGLRPAYLTGYVKFWDEKVVTQDDRHAWNAVYWRNQWHLLDATWAEGYLDEGPRTYPPPYFDVDPEKMIASHLPDDPEWQLRGRNQMTRAEFDDQCLREPEFFDLGLELLDTTSYRMEFDRECTIRLKAPPELYMEAILERNGKDLPSECVLLNRRGDMRAIEVRPPKAGQYTLSIWAGSQSKQQHVLTYHLESLRSAETMPPYPTSYNRYQIQAALLHEPLQGVLKKGRRHFHLTVPGARQVYVRCGLKVVPLSKNGDEFEGDCFVEPGEVAVEMETEGEGLLPSLAGGTRHILLSFESR
ncbi:hypothetical protein JST97_20345 [bacterium]|nr:hypothetical protein [bacterium]